MSRETDESPSVNATFTDSVNSEPNAKEETKQEVPEPSKLHMLADEEQIGPLRSERHTWKEEEEEDPPNLEPVPLDEEEREELLSELHANEKMKREGAPQDKEARANEDNENGLFPFRPSVPMDTTVPGPSVLTAWEEREREDMFAWEPHVGEKLKRDDTLEVEKEDNSSVSREFADFDDSGHPADSDDSEHPADSNDSEHPEHTIIQMRPKEDDEYKDEDEDVTFEEDSTEDKRSHKHHGHTWKDHRENDDHYRENIHVEVRIREAECYSSHTESSFIVFLVALDFSHVYLSSVLIKSEKFTFDNVTNTHSYKGYLDKQKNFQELDECFQEGNIDCVPRADAVFIRFGSEPDDPWAIDQIDVDVKFYLGLEEDDWFEWHFEHALLLPCSSWLNERNTYQIGPRVRQAIPSPKDTGTGKEHLHVFLATDFKQNDLEKEIKNHGSQLGTVDGLHAMKHEEHFDYIFAIFNADCSKVKNWVKDVVQDTKDVVVALLRCQDKYTATITKNATYINDLTKISPTH
nr:unnamed protein product [Haemonchus contortus]